MRIQSIAQEPIAVVRVQNAARGGGTVTERLPILSGRVDRLPDGLDGLLVASDLQCVEHSADAGRGPQRLGGVVLAERYAELAVAQQVPDPERVGVILAGDLYSAPAADVRGATGDVRAVWTAFADRFRWVVGVAGNHDTFGTTNQRFQLENRPQVSLLDGGVAERDGIRFGGVGLIIGRADKVGRRGEEDFLGALYEAFAERPEVMILHEGPPGDAEVRSSQRGEPMLIEHLNECSSLELVVCGHRHWQVPLANLRGQLPGRRPSSASRPQILNVDGRAVLLTADG